MNLTLYIGPVDTEKAFDHVPRSLLLKKLVKFGIGKCMLFALKQINSFSICVINFQGELSSSFRMEHGVRQWAALSALLFITFMDGLFQHLEENCSLETLLTDIHALIHADDTTILSTDRLKFIQKCNELIRFFNMHRLKLNLGKSGYFIINPKENDVKHSIMIPESGLLKYTSEIVYLGVIITDIGSIKHDVHLYINKKRPNVSIKFTNFCKTNRNAPLYVKLEVLEKCVSSALTYVKLGGAI